MKDGDLAVKQALIVAFLGVVRDRFTQTGEPLSLQEKLRRASSIQGVKGVEIIYPDECHEPVELLEALHETGLQCAAVNVNLKGRPEFQRGALSVSDSSTRTGAVDQIVEAKRFALAVGAERVTCAPLADGYDYSMSQNHRGAWKRLVSSLQAAIENGPQIPLFLEHKPSDPRVRGILTRPETVLHLLDDVDRQAAGITFNVGHASIDGHSPASGFSTVLDSGWPAYVHLTDAAKSWDWDVLPGSYHLWQLLEFLQLLRTTGYSGWLTSDSFPLRYEAATFCGTHVESTQRALEKIELFPSDLSEPGAVGSWKDLEQWLFPIQPV